MKMTELEFGGAQPPIDGYAPDGFRIAGAFYEGSLILGPSGVQSWEVGQLAAPAAEALRVLKGEIDILLIGLGAEVYEVPADFRAAMAPLEADIKGFGVDYMSTPSACRTYNVLLSEGRRAGAALIKTGATE